MTRVRSRGHDRVGELVTQALLLIAAVVPARVPSSNILPDASHASLVEVHAVEPSRDTQAPDVDSCCAIADDDIRRNMASVLMEFPVL